MMRSENIDSFQLNKILKEYTPTKAMSPYTKLSLFSNSRSIERDSLQSIRIKRSKGLTPVMWNIKDEELHPIKSRSRLEDFTHDSIRHLFPDKSPSFSQTRSTVLPPILNKEKFYNKKNDSISLHREALLRLRKQGFLITRNK